MGEIKTGFFGLFVYSYNLFFKCFKYLFVIYCITFTIEYLKKYANYLIPNFLEFDIYLCSNVLT